MNAIRKILEESVRTGKRPGREAADGIFRRGTQSERDEVRRGIHRAVLQIQNLQDSDDQSDLEDQIEDVIAATAERYGHLVRGAAGHNRAEETRESPYDAEGIEWRRQQAVADRKRRDPLKELFLGAAFGGGLDPRDLHQLVVRADVPPEQVQQWRVDVTHAAERLARIREAGNQAEARRKAEELAEKYSGVLPEVGQQRDPLADIENPRELAAAIVARSRG